METTGIAQHPLLRLPSNTADRFPIKFHLGVGDLRVSERSRESFGRLTLRFSDSGHQQYYVSSRSGTKKKEKEKGSEIKSVKNKLKLVKRLSSDLSSFSLVANGGKETGNDSMDEAKISDAVELLQAQLQQLRSEQKDLKRKMKEEKVRIKTTIKQSKCKSDSSSSSSSESSDSECGEVIDMGRMRSNDFKQSKYSEAQKVLQDKSVEVVPNEVSSLQNPGENCCGSSNGTSTKKIEICMGGKCKKSGAGALLEELQRKVGGAEGGAVLGCKCMGKCKNGPNLRVSGRSSIDSICIGVGLKDVDAVLANIFGEEGDANWLMAPS